MKKSTWIFRSLLSGLLSFLMSLSIVLTTICCAAAFLTNSPSFTERVLRTSGYAEHLASELQEEFISYGSACNIDEIFFTRFFEEENLRKKVETDTETMFSQFFAGDVLPLETEELRKSLYERLQIYADEKGFRLDKIVLENLENISKELEEIYTTYVSILSTSYFKTASRMLVKFRPYALYGALAGLGCLLLSAVFILLFYRKSEDWLSFFIYAFSGAALMLLAAPAAALLGGVPERVNLGSASLYGLVTGILNGMLYAVLASAALPLLLTFLLSIFYVRAARKSKRTRT